MDITTCNQLIDNIERADQQRRDIAEQYNNELLDTLALGTIPARKNVLLKKLHERKQQLLIEQNIFAQTAQQQTLIDQGVLWQRNDDLPENRKYNIYCYQSGILKRIALLSDTDHIAFPAKGRTITNAIQGAVVSPDSISDNVYTMFGLLDPALINPTSYADKTANIEQKCDNIDALKKRLARGRNLHYNDMTPQLQPRQKQTAGIRFHKDGIISFQHKVVRATNNGRKRTIDTHVHGFDSIFDLYRSLYHTVASGQISQQNIQEIRADLLSVAQHIKKNNDDYDTQQEIENIMQQISNAQNGYILHALYERLGKIMYDHPTRDGNRIQGASNDMAKREITIANINNEVGKQAGRINDIINMYITTFENYYTTFMLQYMRGSVAKKQGHIFLRDRKKDIKTGHEKYHLPHKDRHFFLIKPFDHIAHIWEKLNNEKTSVANQAVFFVMTKLFLDCQRIIHAREQKNERGLYKAIHNLSHEHIRMCNQAGLLNDIGRGIEILQEKGLQTTHDDDEILQEWKNNVTNEKKYFSIFST